MAECIRPFLAFRVPLGCKERHKALLDLREDELRRLPSMHGVFEINHSEHGKFQAKSSDSREESADSINMRNWHFSNSSPRVAAKLFTSRYRTHLLNLWPICLPAS